MPYDFLKKNFLFSLEWPQWKESSPHTLEVIGLKSKIVTLHWYKYSSICAFRNDFWPNSLLSRHQALLDFVLIGPFFLLDLATVYWTFNIIWVFCCYGLSRHLTFYLLDVSYHWPFYYYGHTFEHFNSLVMIWDVYTLNLVLVFLGTAATQHFWSHYLQNIGRQIVMFLVT
jgi:hypothetical protein